MPLPKWQYKQLETDARRRHYAEQLTLLVKLLDIVVANMLLDAYQRYPDEVGRDLDIIMQAHRENHLDDIEETLRWYRERHMAELTAKAVHKPVNLVAKSELALFRRKSAAA